jgi:D-3-phosphoglycerate dehydrogenase / 2-oxoglutarate reductase
MNKQRPVVGITYNQAFPVDDVVVRKALGSLADVRMIEMPTGDLTEAEEAVAAQQMKDVVAVLFRPGTLSRSLLTQCPNLRMIAVHGAGYDKVDLPTAAERGIIVTNAPGANATGVAELTIAVAIALIRHVVSVAEATRGGLWNEARRQGTELAGKTLGILGVGHVGSRVASRALAFEMKVVAYDPAYTSEQLASRGIEWHPFDEVIDSADILTVHVPLEDKTFHLLDDKAISHMKRGAYLLNLARGPVVDERAVERALREGRLAGAAFDVREEEPHTEVDSLMTLPNVIVTPHIGGSTDESLSRIAQVCADEIARFLRGEPPVNVVLAPIPARP